MRDLYDITESLLDDEDEIMSKADDAASIAAAADWLKKHGVMYRLEDIVKNPSRNKRTFDPDTNTWHLGDVELQLMKGDEWPDFVKIDKLRSIKIVGYDKDTLPDGMRNIAVERLISIRNCPKLKSLMNCPQGLVDRFAVSGCPNLKHLAGCPREAISMFKFVNNGIKVTYKDIRKFCIIEKKNTIYD